MSASFHSSILKEPVGFFSFEDYRSSTFRMGLVPHPTRRYLRRRSLEYLHCPDCESSDITFYGKSSSGTQKYRCKACAYQFIAQFDAYFPRSRRRQLFEQEYLGNLKATGFEKGSGRKKYWKGAFLLTMSLLESDRLRIRVNKMIRSTDIQCDRDYQHLLDFTVHEAYLMAMSLQD